MKELKSRSFVISCLILFLIGLGVEIWQAVSKGAPLFVFLSDLFFAEFILFLVFGGFRMLGNMHAFTTASYSFRFVHRLFRNQKVSGKDSRDEYLNYRASRPKHPEAKGYLIIAAVFLVLAAVTIPMTVSN